MLMVVLGQGGNLGAQSNQTAYEMGEGNEVVVTRGFHVLEIPTGGKLPKLAVGTSMGYHFRYDPNQLTMDGFWTGQFGRLDSNGNFIASDRGLKSFSLDRFPWSFGENPRRECKHEWRGYEIRPDRVVFRYRLSDSQSGMFWDVEESLEFVSEQQQHLHFSIRPNKESEDYLNYWLHQTDFRRVTTDGQQNQRNLLKNLFPNQRSFSISFFRRKETPTLPHGYSVHSIPIPNPDAPLLFEPTGFDFSPDGSLYVSTRTGGVWHRKNDQWTLFADGLQEVNGVQVALDGKGVYVMQKPELTLLRDTDGDGKADLYQTVEDRYRFTGQYHEFAYGPRMNANGDLYFSTGLSAGSHHMAAPDGYPNQMTSALGYRGWVMKRTPQGELIPFASGLRSPAGIGMNAKDELFVTDNQGDWVASSYLTMVEEGDFLGHPASFWDRPEFGITPRVLDFKSNDAIPERVPPLDPETFRQVRKRPAAWLAHGDLTNAPGHPSFAPSSGFGPFTDQAFIADIAHRDIVRVALEKVAGQYQGAVFPFIRPLKSASYSTAFDPEGNLWVGSVGRGWTPGESMIEIIQFETGKNPFEIHRIALTKTGFDIHFTQPLGNQKITARDVTVAEFQYQYWDNYGSERFHESMVALAGMTLSGDRKRLSLRLPLKADFIYEIQLSELTSATGLTLENNYGIYTLNRLLP